MSGELMGLIGQGCLVLMLILAFAAILTDRDRRGGRQ